MGTVNETQNRFSQRLGESTKNPNFIFLIYGGLKIASQKKKKKKSFGHLLNI